MECPVDGTTLVMSDRQGIEIDYCPECRGVWLDRGELDKLVEREQQWVESQTGGKDTSTAKSSKPEKTKKKPEKTKKKKVSSFLQDIMEMGQG
jgi:uncharacterized protein